MYESTFIPRQKPISQCTGKCALAGFLGPFYKTYDGREIICFIIQQIHRADGKQRLFP
jgi:hypothetical protein